MKCQTEILAEIKGLRKELVEIRVEMGIFKNRINRWSALMTAIPVTTAVVLILLRG